MNKEKAQEIADKYAKKNGYESAEFKQENYMLDGFVDCYAFYLTEKDSGEIKLVGLPEALFIEKISGEAIQRRELI